MHQCHFGALPSDDHDSVKRKTLPSYFPSSISHCLRHPFHIWKFNTEHQQLTCIFCLLRTMNLIWTMLSSCTFKVNIYARRRSSPARSGSKKTRREKYGQYLKIPFERWHWFSFSNQIKILHCTWMESPNSYTSVSILLWNRSRLNNLTQFDEAAVAEFLWLTSFLLNLTDFNFLAEKICVEHWVLFHNSRGRSASSILFALKLCSLNMHHSGWCVKC